MDVGLFQYVKSTLNDVSTWAEVVEVRQEDVVVRLEGGSEEIWDKNVIEEVMNDFTLD